ncbi:MAG: ATP synthase F1 subunit delta [Proteobacteria bacterium]|nr:ATP synthase F1 subunit delta [Pseudomonadota bacterium]
MTYQPLGLESRYSKALYALAEKAGSVDATYTELQALKDACAGDLGAVLTDGSLKAKVKADILADVTKKAKMSDLIQKFVQVVAANGRSDCLPAMVDAFDALRAANNAEVTAVVTSAQPLSAAQQKNIIAFVKTTDKAIKAVKLSEKIDPTLMAGLKVRIGSTEYDSSLRGALTDLRTAMKG